MNDLVFLRPIFHNKPWGGRRLETEYGYDLPEGPVGECWAISAHPHGDCLVEGGQWDGWHLSELWEKRRDLFGNARGNEFPLLVKILDAEDDLSIQVHPDDAYAAEHEDGSLGKRECWYVIDVHEGGHILIGQHARSRDEFARMAAEGRWHELVNEVSIQRGDFFQIEPGTVHAILGGTLVLETQQSSDVTYRVYDYDRVQPDGTLRELHLERAMDVIDYKRQAPQTGRLMASEHNGVTHLVTTPSYAVDRIVVTHGRAVVYEQMWPFLCMSVVKGAGSVCLGNKRFDLASGTHCVAPSGCGALEFEGSMTLVVSHM